MTISTFLIFSQSYIFNFCKCFFTLLVVSFLFFVCVLFFVVVVVVVMFLPTFFFTGCIQEDAGAGTSPFCHSCNRFAMI